MIGMIPSTTFKEPLLPATTNQESHIHIKCQKTILTSITSTFWLHLNLNHKHLEIKTLRLGLWRGGDQNHKFLLPLRLWSPLMRPRSPGTQASAPPFTLNTSMEQFGKHKPPNHDGSDWISRKNSLCDKFWTATSCPAGGNDGPETQNLSILKTQWRAGSFSFNHSLQSQTESMSTCTERRSAFKFEMQKRHREKN